MLRRVAWPAVETPSSGVDCYFYLMWGEQNQQESSLAAFGQAPRMAPGVVSDYYFFHSDGALSSA